MAGRKVTGFVTAETKIEVLAKIAVNASARDEAIALVALEHHVDHVVIFSVLDRLQVEGI